MEDMINLSDLLKHEILDLYSAEEQIIEALPAMIEKANNSELKKALREHLAVTKEQKNRLDQIKEWMGESTEGNEKNRGFFSRMFSGSNGSGGEKCKGMEGLITEGEKMMAADASEEVCDAAIIASAQKIEHYEISGYGTARTYARELQLNEVAGLLEQTLNEEYQADDLLTKIATGRINLEAEEATELADDEDETPTRTSAGNKSSRGKSSSATGGGRSSSKTTKSKSSSNGRSAGSSKNASSKSSSGSSSRSGSNGQSNKNKKSDKSSSGNKKSARSKSGASRNR